MAGGFIFEKNILAGFQNGVDKSLLIEPNYAYQVPFSFTDDWNEIKVGLFISFVATGAGNENSGYTTGRSTQAQYDNTSASAIADAGGTTPDTFFQFGIVREGATNELPRTLGSSGFMGMSANIIFCNEVSNSTLPNRLADTTVSGRTDGVAKIFSSTGAVTLQETKMGGRQGNWCAVGSDVTQMDNLGIGNAGTDGNPNEPNNYFWYWGATFRVLNKGQPNQMIKLLPSCVGSVTSKFSNNPHFGRALSDPSTGALVSLINGNNELNENDSTTNYFDPMQDISTNVDMPASSGHIFNDGTNACALPDSLFIYNAFTNVRPRIHAWAVKKIS